MSFGFCYISSDKAVLRPDRVCVDAAALLVSSIAAYRAAIYVNDTAMNTSTPVRTIATDSAVDEYYSCSRCICIMDPTASIACDILANRAIADRKLAAVV